MEKDLDIIKDMHLRHHVLSGIAFEHLDEFQERMTKRLRKGQKEPSFEMVNEIKTIYKMKQAILNKSTDGQYYWSYKQSNGEIISSTETFVSHYSALKNLISHLSFFESSITWIEFIKLHVNNNTGEDISWIKQLI